MAPLTAARAILFAKDMQRMAAFYEHTLGLRRLETPDGSDDFVSFDAGGIQLSLHRIPEAYARHIEISDPPQAREGTPIKLAFRADDVSATRDDLVARGAVMFEAQRAGDLHLCDGIDPEGNVFQLSNRA